MLVYLACLLLALSGVSAKTSCKCGWVNKGQTAEGSGTPKHKYPMAVILEVPLIKTPFCAGTIITPWHVLTTGSCATKHTLMQVRVGAHSGSRSGKSIGVAKKIIHANYYKHSVDSDIAILVTKEKMDFDDEVGPACLPNQKLNLVDKRVTALGWSGDQHQGSSSKNLKEFDMKVKYPDYCKKRWKNFEENVMFCTHGEVHEACKGDKGGPVIWLDPQIERYTLVGLVSFGYKCGGQSPSLNADVSAYIPWINQKVKESKPGVNVCTKV